MSILYEVNLEIEPAQEQAYRDWMPGHIQDVLATGCFTEARRYVAETAPGEPLQWSTHYIAPDRASLERYFKDHAPGLRKHGLDRFGAGFKPSRRILTPANR